MNLARVRAGDTVECVVRGFYFLARFEHECDDGTVRITPLKHNLSFYHVSKRDMKRKLTPKQVEAWENPIADTLRKLSRPRSRRLA